MTGTGPRCVKSVSIGISTMSEHHHTDATVECREATGSPGRLIGTILPVGRVAGDRAELFVGSGVQTPAEGIALLPEHRSSTVVMRFDPIRGDDGTLKVDHRLPNSPEGRALAASVRSGATTGLSVEFHAFGRSTGVKASERCVNRWSRLSPRCHARAMTRRAPKCESGHTIGGC